MPYSPPTFFGPTAPYIAPNGKTVHARKLDEDRIIDNVGTVGKAGEWLVFVDGRPNLCVEAAFRQQFTQKYPRPADSNNLEAPLPDPSPRAA